MADNTVSDDRRAGVLVEDIDLSFVPAPSGSVVEREIDGQTVLVDPATGTVHVLNNVGSVVWRCFDDDADLGELTDALADAFDAPQEVVRADVILLTKTLARIGVLDGITTPPPVITFVTGVDVGKELEPFQLPDIDGTTVDLTALRGEAVLLINWSPHCGYCVQIAPELASLQASLLEHGTRLVLLAAGAEAPNRALLAEHGLTCLTLLSELPDEDEHAHSHSHAHAHAHFHDPFPGLGTPAVYLLDREGKVAAPLTFGAGQVTALARRTAGEPEPPVARTDVKYLVGASEGMCGAGANNKAPRVWTATNTFRIGEYHIGIRADSVAAAELVGRALSAYRAEDDPNIPANYSLVLGDPVAGPSRDLRLLLWANSTVVRSRSARRALLALAAHLSAVFPPDDGLMRTSNLAVVRGGQALLLPPSTSTDLERLQPRLARVGFAIVDEPYATVDPARAELVVTAPSIVLDAQVLAELDEPELGRTELPRVEPGRYPLAAWGVWGGDEPLSRAEIVSQALTSVMDEPELVIANLDRVDELLDRVPPFVLDPHKSDQVANQLLNKFGRAQH